jgi:hypothetical protein
LFEYSAAVLKIFKLIEAGASRREEHRIARFCAGSRLSHCGFEVFTREQRDFTA